MKTLIILIFLTSSSLVSNEIDSSNNESIFKVKEKNLGIEFGVANPPIIYIGTTIHLKNSLYFSFKIGAFPALRDLTYLTIPMDQFAFSSELFYYFGKKSEIFKYGAWNLSVGLTHYDKFESLFEKKPNYIYYLSYRLGKDFQLNESILFNKFILRTNLGFISAIYANESKTYFMPALNFSILYWL